MKSSNVTTLYAVMEPFWEARFFRYNRTRAMELHQRGLTLFQSFIGGIVAYRALPRPQFSTLQQAIFPIYFSMQTALPVVLALTYPGSPQTFGSASVPSGLHGFFTEKNRSSVLIPLTTIFATSIVNMLFIGPATTRVMRERKHQGPWESLLYSTSSWRLTRSWHTQKLGMVRKATTALHIPRR